MTLVKINITVSHKICRHLKFVGGGDNLAQDLKNRNVQLKNVLVSLNKFCKHFFKTHLKQQCEANSNQVLKLNINIIMFL